MDSHKIIIKTCGWDDNACDSIGAWPNFLVWSRAVILVAFLLQTNKCNSKHSSACNSTSVEALTWLDESLMMIFCQWQFVVMAGLDTNSRACLGSECLWEIGGVAKKKIGYTNDSPSSSSLLHLKRTRIHNMKKLG